MTVEQPTTNDATVSDIMEPLHDAAGWMKLLGTLSIIYGVFAALSIVGLLVAWLPIWMGILLRGAAVEAQAAYATGDAVAAATATSKLRTMFKVQGIIALIGLVLFAIWIIFIVVAIAVSVSNS